MEQKKNKTSHAPMPLIRMTRISAMAALLCILAPWSIPVGPIPISLATLAVYFIGVLTGAVDGTIAVAIYLLLGAVGVPVFSGFEGGIQKLLGVTGGYLIGYLPCVLITGLFSDRSKNRWLAIAGMILGTIVLYAIGTAWFTMQTERTLLESMSLCVIPFLPGDAVKIAVAGLSGIPLRNLMEKRLNLRR